MEKIIILTVFLVITIVNTHTLHAQENVILVSERTTGCSKQALDELIKAVNEYRAEDGLNKIRNTK